MIVTKWTGLCYYIGALLIYSLACVIMVVVDGSVPNKQQAIIIHHADGTLPTVSEELYYTTYIAYYGQ